MSLSKGIVVFVVMTTLVGFLGAPHMAWAVEEPSGEDILLDVCVLRILGVSSVIGGVTVFVVASPWALLTGSTRITAEKLIVEPFYFTFRRPLGQNNGGPKRE